MKSFLRVLICLSYLLVSYSSVADDSGFYIGVSAGASNLDEDAGAINTELAAEAAVFSIVGFASTTTVDDDDLGWKIYGGYNFNKYFSVELGYTDLGEAELNTTITAPALVAGTLAATADLTGFQFAGIASYPVSEEFDVFGKIGAYVWESDATAVAVIAGLTEAVKAEQDGTDILFGLGAEYNFTNNITLRAEWERFSGLTDDENDVDLFSVGIQYNFDL